MCEEADLPAPSAKNIGIVVVLSILPVYKKDLSVDLGSLSNPSTAHLAAAYVLIIFTLRLFSNSPTETENGWSLLGSRLKALTRKGEQQVSKISQLGI